VSARERIVKQAESQGWTVTRIEWEPVRDGGEKSGPEGGWWVDLERDGIEEQALGYNWQQAVQWMKNLDLPYTEKQDPFACSGKTHSLVAGDCAMARGHRGPHWPVDETGRMASR
jgi:hypothetical protein